MAETKNLCAQLDLALHTKVCEEREKAGQTMFVFGQAPAGFAQVETPYLNCTAVANLPANSSFVNIADVGGVYNGTWVQAISRWVTTVYGKPDPLPRTGY